MNMLNESKLEQMKTLIDFTDKWFKINKDLVEYLELRKKMLGFLGEFEVVKILYDKFRDRLSKIKWYGGGKRGYDIEITTKEGNKIRIQVKTSSTAAFRVLNVKNADKYKTDIEKAYTTSEQFVMPKDLEAEIYRQIDDTLADYWILIDWVETGKRYFILTKDEVKQISVKDYERYMNHRKNKGRYSKGFNYGITSSKTIGIIVHYKDWTDFFEECKGGWDKFKI